MIITTEWLLDYLSPRVPLPDLLTALPRVGLDVEATHVLAKELAPVRIGFIRSKKELGGGKYSCGIEVARGDIRNVVCASMHPVEIGWGVPVVLAGTELPTGASIREETFQGVLSQGMICADGELGMVATGTGLQVFHDEAWLGKSLIDVMDVPGALVHLKVYPNRPDCLGMIGIAREIAALLGVSLVLPQAPSPTQKSSSAMPVEIADPALCARYTCQVIEGVKIGPSPAWLASRLLATGSKPINNVVDITNFVLKEWGHPLHAFDLAKVSGKIVVRRMQAAETCKVLDGRVIEGAKENSPLVIADAAIPVALAGIMGGLDSAITEQTTNVLLEAALFEPTNIRLTSRRLALSTDASYRFERGLDANETLQAARERASALLFSAAGAQSAGPVSDAYPKPIERTVFSLAASRVSSYLGLQVSPAQVAESLTKLGYGCAATGEVTEVSVPTRRVDVNDAVVLIEDIARVIGYDKIVPAPTEEVPTAGATSSLDRARQAAREMFVGNGFLELRGVPLEPASEAVFTTGDAVTLANPLNADLAQVRRSLVPFLLNTAELNAKRRASSYRYFEIDKTFSRAGEGIQEQWSLGILLGGANNDADWSTRRDVDFFDLKGTVESLLESLRLPGAQFSPVDCPGYSAAALITLNGKEIGVMGQIAPELLAPRKIQAALFAAEIKLAPLAGGSARYTPLPRFPGVFRDLSFVVKKEIAYAAIAAAIRNSAGEYLENVDCIDVFAGKTIDKDSRSIAVSMAFRAADRTLSSEEVATSLDRVIVELARQFKAELRSGT